MIEAVLLDFYGTVVHEDDVVIEQICTTISRTAAVSASPREIGRHWWTEFAGAFERSHGHGFRTQRAIELASLACTIEHFGARCDARRLTRPLFEFWQRPPAFEDAIAFLAAIDAPVVVVSNIDRADIEAAIDHHGFTFDHVVTSEDVHSYKPRPELFRAGIAAAGCPPDRLLHVGDSLTSDVAGARRLGIPVAWVNRRGKPSPPSSQPTYEVSNLADLVTLLEDPR